MIVNLIKRLMGSGYAPFSGFWRRLVQTRLFLCLLVISFVYLGSSTLNKGQAIFFAVGYLAFNVLLGFISSDTLQRDAVRAIPDIVDIVFISLVIYAFGGMNNSWFLIYFFPIISASRFLGYGALLLASLASISYLILYSFPFPGPNLDLPSVILRCLTFIGVATVAGNIARTKHVEEVSLIKAFDEINVSMLSGMERRELFTLILKKALQITDSDTGHIKLLNHKTGKLETVAAIGHAKKEGWGMQPISEGYSDSVVRSREPLIISDINRPFLRTHLIPYRTIYTPRPRSALFLPLVREEAVLGAVAVFSRNRFHYKRTELTRLRSFASLIVMAQNSADLYEELQNRLKLLHHIGEQLKAGQNLNEVFDDVVNLIFQQLDSEEAALFVPDEQNPGRIVKVAVRGPSEDVTGALRTVELYYSSGESFAGSIFQNKEAIFTNSVSSDVQYVHEYEQVIPSNQIRHYIGVPLFIGDEILGVIRVINKKAANYSLDQKKFELSRVGFLAADLQLMQTIASQVSVAIMNAGRLQSEKMNTLGRLAHTVGHDIKTDIGTALNYLEILSFGLHEDSENVAERDKFYSEIERALTSSVDKLQSLLMVTQPKAPEMSATTLEEILLGIQEQMEAQAAGSGIKLCIKFPPEEYGVSADIGQMKQVFSNLFDNSMHAIKRCAKSPSDPGRIILSAKLNQTYLQVHWEDNGCGISEKNLPKVFLPFYTDKRSGNGLGLFLVRTVIENHGGVISVDSEEGRGARFTLMLPLLNAPPTHLDF